MKKDPVSPFMALALLVSLLLSSGLFAQKAVEPVTREDLLGMSLPAGSKLDNRGLYRSVAEMVIAPQVKGQGKEIDRFRVYSLPPSQPAGFTYDSLAAGLRGAGWVLTQQKDKDFTLAVRGEDQAVVYFKPTKKQSDLYVAWCKAGTVQPPPVAENNMQPLITGPGTSAPPQPVNRTPDVQVQGTPVTDPGAMEWINKIWIKNSSVSPEYGNAVATNTAGYVKSQLQFKPDGTYEFYSKVFGYSMQYLTLIREKGTFTIHGSQLTLNPVSNILETWTKKDKNDKFGVLVSTQKLEPERTTYNFQHYYFRGIEEWNLLLQVNPPTHRDGPYGQNPAFQNTYFYRPAGPTAALIDLPD